MNQWSGRCLVPASLYILISPTPATMTRFDEFKFSFFKGGIDKKYPAGTLTLTEVVALVGGPAYEVAVRDVRATLATVSKKAADEIKRKLDYVTFSGTFAPHREAKNLQQHSGLAMIDFDHVDNLADTRLQLQADPYALVIFVSPSGDGLKLILEIEASADRHGEIYTDLLLYYKQTYGLESKIDSSCRDVSRACFLSWDPNVYTNPAAVKYAMLGLARKVEKPRAELMQVHNASQVYKHVRAVVERIVENQIDITGDYSLEWLLIAFCMATLGEEGRALFLQVSSCSPKYDEADANAKFDNAVQTSRFTTPWKFFDICKDYGVDVSKPQKPATKNLGVEHVSQSNEPGKEEIKEKATKVMVGPNKKKGRKHRDDDDSEGDFAGSVWYRGDHEIWIKSKGWSVVADNFLIYIKYVTEDEYENLTWVLEIKPRDSDPIYIEVPHEDFCSASRLKRIITGKQYSLKISDNELSELQSYLFSQTRFVRAIKITRYGYHAPSGVFFFANKAVMPGHSELLAPDQFGMIETRSKEGKPMFLSMPQNNKHKAHRFTLTDTQLSVNRFFQLYAQAHNYENVIMPFCHYLMSLYRDVAIKHKNFSPILYLKGGAGTGKSSIVRILTAAFGKKQEGVNLKSKNTESALVKLMGQSSNTPIWFDEFHNELQGIEGLLQAAYDNDGYHRSKDSTSSDTDAIEIYSALALTSNFLPENPIFFSRCVFVAITSQEKTDAQREAFYELEELQEDGLGCLTVELLQHRALVEKEYGAAFDLLHKGLKAAFVGEKVPERFFANMAQLMAVTLILCTAQKIQITESSDSKEILSSLVESGVANIRRQYRIMAERTALTEFFEIIQSLYDSYQIHEEVHFDFQHVGSENRIRLWFPQLYNLYAQSFRRTFQKAPADKDTLQSEIAALEDFTDWDAMKKSIRFRNDGEGTATSTTIPRTGCCSMDYDKLRTKFGLSLELRKAKN